MTVDTKRGVDLSKFFLLAVVIKVVFAFLGYQFDSPWVLGACVPLAAMAVYIYIGFFHRNHMLSDERFADSCYYLGFIFTIMAIVVSLIDIQSVGDDLESIAVRFGAALVSTVVGIAVRVYIVNFKEEANEEIKRLEEQTAETMKRLQGQLETAYAQFAGFQEKVANSAETMVDKLGERMDQTIQSHTAKVEEFFDKVIERNKESLDKSAKGIELAAADLAKSVATSDSRMNLSLQQLSDNVTRFGAQLMGALDKMKLPSDYFDERVGTAVQQLADSIVAYKAEINGSLDVLKTANKTVSTALTNSNKKFAESEKFFDQIESFAKVVNGLKTYENEAAQALRNINASVDTHEKTLVATQGAITTLIAQLKTSDTQTSNATKGLQEQLEKTLGMVQTQSQIAAQTAAALSNLQKLPDDIKAAINALAKPDSNNLTKPIEDLAAQLSKYKLEELAPDLKSLTNKLSDNPALGNIEKTLVEIKALAAKLPAPTAFATNASAPTQSESEMSVASAIQTELLQGILNELKNKPRGLFR